MWRPDQPCPYRPVGTDAAILRLVADGLTDHAIGQAVGLATASVSHRVGRLCRLLGLHGAAPGSSGRRAQLAAWAGAHGYGPPGVMPAP